METVATPPQEVELDCTVNGEATLSPLVGLVTVMTVEGVLELLAAFVKKVDVQPAHTSARRAESRIFIKSASYLNEQAHHCVACFIAKNSKGGA